jgi:DNA repair exonuclease SbcCD nuclease subunit
MKIIETKINIGVAEPVRIIHASDTHLTDADMRDGERKVTLSKERANIFPHANEMLEAIGKMAREENLPIIHTGDLIDFVSLANLEKVKAFTDEYDCLVAAGNHEFSQYVGEAWEDAEYRNQSLDKVQEAFKNDIRMSSRVIGGVNFVALDNGYYLFDVDQLEFLKKEEEKGLPIVLALHDPLYDEEHFEMIMQKSSCAGMVGVPEPLMKNYPPYRYKQQLADKITVETVEHIKAQPLIKAILAGHLHHNHNGAVGDRIPQIVTGCTTLRIVEFN